MSGKCQFHTARGYALLEQNEEFLTPCMEDYLEMIYRISNNHNFVRMGDLARALNVKTSSANKMVNKLKDYNLLNYEKYGLIELTEEGTEIGKYLLKRHKIIESFLDLISNGKNVLEETEKIEHNISESTLTEINIITRFINENPEIMAAYQIFKVKC